MIQTFVLIAVFYVSSSGGTMVTQEFTSKEHCEAAKIFLYNERKRVDISLETAFCVVK